jgi:hypothetical protein
MAETLPKPNIARKSKEVSEQKSYVFVGLWIYWYRFKATYAGYVIASLVVLLSTVELIGPLTHLFPEGDIATRAILASVLLIAAGGMIWHHWLLDRKIKQYEIVLTSVRAVLEEEMLSQSDSTVEKTAKILDAIVFALKCERKEAGFNATVLVRQLQSNRPFKLYAQDKAGNFDSAVEVHGEASVAGKVVAEEKDKHRSLLYVPSVRYKHAVLLALEKRGTNQQVFQTSRVVPAAYSPARIENGTAPNKIGCLLCIQIPRDPETGANYEAVLGISAHKEDYMGTLDFAAARMAAVLLSRVMNNVQVSDEKAEARPA